MIDGFLHDTFFCFLFLPSYNMSEKPNEVERLNKFVEAAPQYSYNIDQYRGQICRQLPGGQEECLKLSLECK